MHHLNHHLKVELGTIGNVCAFVMGFDGPSDVCSALGRHPVEIAKLGVLTDENLFGPACLTSTLEQHSEWQPITW
jgi:hypothetical protein